MADKKISQLTASTTPLAGTEVLPVVQSGVTKQVSVANLTAGRPVSALQLNVNTGDDAVSANLYGRSLDNASNVFFYDNAGTTQYGNIFANASEVGIQSIGARPLSLGANGTTHFQINTTGNLVVIGAGKGIDFSADGQAAGMTSELLNDYEEGDWQAVISDGTTDATMNATFCTYTKIGRQVTLTGYISTSDITGITGALRIKGLPFTAQGAAKFYAANTAGFGGGLNLTAGESIAMLVEPGGAYINLYRWAVAGGTTSLYPAEWTADGSISFNLTYFVA